MEPSIPDILFTFNIFANAVLTALIIAMIGFGAARSPAPRGEKITTAAYLLGAYLGWLLLAWGLGRSNVYWAPENLNVPTIPFAILIPIVVGLWALISIPRLARLVDAVPMSWLVGVQVYRVLGYMFLVLWLGGDLPWQFALPAGIGDVATGIFAPVVAVMLMRGAAGATRAAYSWCLFGIADLVLAVAMGTLTSPGRLHFLALEAPNLLVTAYPLVMIPTFAVPLSIILHGAVLWKIRRARAA